MKLADCVTCQVREQEREIAIERANALSVDLEICKTRKDRLRKRIEIELAQLRHLHRCLANEDSNTRGLLSGVIERLEKL